MNHRKTILILLFMLTGSIVLCQTRAAGSDDQRTLKTKVVDVLTEMPAQDEGHYIKLMEDMLILGEPGILMFTDMLQSPGEEDDSRVRLAISGLAKYVTNAGYEDEREIFNSSIMKAIERNENDYIRSFLISQLQFSGTDAIVPFLGKFLMDDFLCEPATITLIAIKSSGSEEVLLKALGESSGANQITIVKALGDLGSAKAGKEIAKLALSEKSELRKVSLYALANSGSPNAEKILFEAANKTGFQYEQTGATQSYMLFIKRIGEAGETKAVERMCHYLMDNAPSNIRSQALSLLIHFKEDEGDQILLDALEDPDSQFRATALQLTKRYPGKDLTQKLVSKLDETPAVVQAEIIRTLGERGDQTAIPSILDCLTHQDQVVRLSAVIAAGLLAGEAAIVPLLDVMQDGTPEDINTVKGTLLFIDSDQLVPAIYNALDEMTPKSKAAVFEVLVNRDPDGFHDLAVLESGNPEKEIRLAAYSALAILATPEDGEVIFKQFITRKDPEERKALQNTVLALAKRMDVAEQSSFLGMFSGLSPENKQYFFEILPEIGGKKALDMVMTDYFTCEENQKELPLETLGRWQTPDAIPRLYDILLEERMDYYRNPAMDYYLEMTKRSRIPDEQKVLFYRQLLELSPCSDREDEILKQLSSLPVFQTLILAGKYLDDPDLQQEAARTIAQIALPSEVGNDGMTGKIVADLLRKAEKVISGEESEKEKQRIREYLSSMPDDEGFVPIFNGKDLTGWQGLVENPIARAQMDPEALKKARQEANRKMHECWKVEDGVIWFNGEGANLCTVKKYGDFELVVDWKITKNGDSGIYLRGSPQVQIWDTSRTEVGAQVGSGGLYNNQEHPSKPLLIADNPVGDWNTFRIIMIGERVTVWLNGYLVVDNVIMENYWDRNQPIFPVEQIELQAHGTNLGFRDIYIREIPKTDHNQLTDEEKQEGFVQLFNGKDLQNWTGNTTDYIVEDGMIVIYPDKGGHGNLYTEKEYADFIFRFEFQLTPGANNGLGIRTPLEGDPAYVGMELQILDNTAPIYRRLEQWQYHGSVYGVIPAKRGFLKPAGEWNSEEVIIRGSDIKIILNGTVIVDGNIAEASKNGTIDGNKHPGLKREKGHIGFLGHGSIVKFRNIRIKEL